MQTSRRKSFRRTSIFLVDKFRMLYSQPLIYVPENKPPQRPLNEYAPRASVWTFTGRGIWSLIYCDFILKQQVTVVLVPRCSLVQTSYYFKILSWTEQVIFWIDRHTSQSDWDTGAVLLSDVILSYQFLGPKIESIMHSRMCIVFHPQSCSTHSKSEKASFSLKEVP